VTATVQAPDAIDVNQRRIKTLRVIAALASGGLPCPARVDMSGRRLTLHFDNDARAIDVWAERLGLTEREDFPVEVITVLPFRSYGASRIDLDQPVWLGWDYVEVETYLPIEAADGAS